MSQNKQELASSLNVKGSILQAKGEYEKAIEVYNRSIDIFNSIDDYRGEADVMNNIGLTNTLKGDHSSAFDYYLKALDLIKNKTFDQLLLYVVNSNIALSYYKTNDKNVAINMWKEALHKYLELNASLDKVFNVISNLVLATHHSEWNELLSYFCNLFDNTLPGSSDNINFKNSSEKHSIIDERQFYKCKLMLDCNASTLDDILIVIYRLHPTFFPDHFQQPIVYSFERNYFPINLRCWGSFNVDIFVVFNNYSCKEYSHYLNIVKSENESP